MTLNKNNNKKAPSKDEVDFYKGSPEMGHFVLLVLKSYHFINIVKALNHICVAFLIQNTCLLLITIHLSNICLLPPLPPLCPSPNSVLHILITTSIIFHHEHALL